MTKTLPVYFRTVASLALLTWALAGCKTTTETERPRVFTVAAGNGEARYQTADSDKWHVIKIRDRISPGSVITTAPGAGNYLDIVAGEVSLVGNHREKIFASNNLRIFEDTTLKLEKVATKTVADKEIDDTRLRLFKGVVRGYTGTPASPSQKVEMIRNQSEQPYYEIRSSNIVVRLQQAGYLFAASGKVVVAFGAATLEFTDSGETKELPARHLYDPATGVVSEFDNDSPYSLLFRHGDYWRRPKEKPLFEVPHRPF